MFAVRDNRTGKFLADFSGSFNRFMDHTRWRLQASLGRNPTWEEVHAAMFCCETPNGAKVYRTRQSVSASFYSYRWGAARRRAEEEQGRELSGEERRQLRNGPLQEVCPWLQIMPVKSILVCEDENVGN